MSPPGPDIQTLTPSTSKTQHGKPTIDLVDFPNEILTLIGTFCGTEQLASLHLVSWHFHEIFNPLLYRSNEINDNPPKPVLLWAVRRGLLETMKLAFKYGADLNYTGAPSEDFVSKYANGEIPKTYRFGPKEMYAAPLHLAVLHKHEHIVEWLLENGARLDVPSASLCVCDPSNSGSHDRRVIPWYPLHYAISHGVNESILSLLVKHGARNAVKGVPGINFAVHGMVRPAIDIILNQGGFDPNWRGSNGATVFHLLDEGDAFHHHLKLDQRCDNTLATISGLAKQGVPIDAQDYWKTIFNKMLSKPNLLYAIELLKAGADASDRLHARRRDPGVIDRIFENIYRCRINGEKRNDNEQLANALIDDQRKALKLAIERGADVNRLFKKGNKLWTRPLYNVLMFSEDFRCVRMMLDAGARIEDAFVDDQSDAGGLLRAFFDGQYGYLRYRYNEDKPIDETDLEPFKKSLKLLLKRGARIDAPSQHHHSALIEVCNRATNVGCDSQYLLSNMEAYRYQLQRLEEYYNRVTDIKRDPFFELEFLVKHATIQNVSAEYVEVLMRRNKDEGKVQDFLKQLHSKLLSGTGPDDDEDDDDEFDDVDEDKNEPDPRSCSICNPMRPS